MPFDQHNDDGGGGSSPHKPDRKVVEACIAAASMTAEHNSECRGCTMAEVTRVLTARYLSSMIVHRAIAAVIRSGGNVRELDIDLEANTCIVDTERFMNDVQAIMRDEFDDTVNSILKDMNNE